MCCAQTLHQLCLLNGEILAPCGVRLRARGPGQLLSFQHIPPAPAPPLLLESPDLLQMESPQRQTPHSAATKDFGTLAEARKTERGV